MTNSLSEDIYTLGELMATNLNTQGVVSADADDGLTTLAGKILDITASGTTLTIEVPLNLVYSDDFNITGTLTDGNNDAIIGATIKLKVGSTVVDTDTTDNDGEVSFTQAPVSMGNHSFQLIFEGDSTHPAANSSVVTREIGKETSAITMSTPAASSSYYSDASISVSGTLKTDDNEAISGASILVKLGATTLTTLTTGNDGSFSGSVSAGDLSTGSNTLKFEFAGDTYYSTTYQEVAVTVNAATLVLSADKSILSYADSESATLTATYTGATVTGKTVKLCKASDDTEIATMTDNNDGTYTATYNSAGVGDIGFYAKVGSLVSETYELQDIYKYDPLTTDKGFFTVCSHAVLSYSEQNNLTITGDLGYQSNYGSNICSEEILLDDFEVTYKLYISNTNRVAIGLHTASGKCSYTQEAKFLRDYGSSTTHYSNNVFPQSTWFDVKFIYENGVVTATINGNTSSSVTIADAKYLNFGFWFESRTIRIKDLKIKAL